MGSLNFSIKDIFSVTLVLFAVIDILGSIPIIIDLKERSGNIQSGKATIVAGVIMILFLFLGESILELFGVDISSFAIAGAIVIFLLATEMILGVEIFKQEAGSGNTTSIVPIAFPLIAGAGTLTTILSIRAEYSFENVLSKPRSPAKDYHMLSPRLGVSFPITENSLLHFNYGHFLQMPPLDQLFELGYFRPIYIVDGMRANNVDHFPSADGDPERVVGFTNAPLKPAKTIMFEVGFKQNFGDLAVLDITAFYKDVFEQTQERVGLFDHAILGYDPFREAVTSNQSYQTFLSGDYGDSRGFEISLRSLFSNNFNIDINYSFSKSVRGRATPSRITLSPGEDPVYDWAAEIEKRIPIENSFSRPHILRANIFLNYPDSDNGIFGGTIADDLLRGTSLSILYNFVSGQAFTYLSPDDPPDTYNNQRFPNIHKVDLRLEKSVQFLDSHTLSVFLQITNLFNTKNLRSYGDALFDADATKKFVESGEITTVDGAGYDISWQTYYDKRRINLGVKYFF